ncbi:MAG: hypothetical protein RL748_3920 [Pseudomonadota bacterium]|jgi:hypothetical protein
MADLTQVLACMVICEGEHDLVVLRRILKDEFKFTEEKWTFSEFPAPLHLYFPTRLRDHAAGDLELGLVHEFFLPNYVFYRVEADLKARMVCLFRTGGDKKLQLAREFVAGLEFFRANAGHDLDYGDDGVRPVRTIGEMRWLFINDADDKGPDGVRQLTLQNWATINDQAWLTGPWIIDAANPLAAHCGNKAQYVWSANGINGTLEDVLYPVVEANFRPLLDECSTFARQHFPLKNQDIATLAKHKKRSLTMAGQGDKPGHGLHLVLKEGKLLQDEALMSNQSIKDFIQFLRDFIK